MQILLLQGERTQGKTMNKRIRKKKRTTQKYVRHKDFLAAQSAYNNHVMIFHDGRMVSHIQCDRRLKRGELIGYIDKHIHFVDHFDEFVRKATIKPGHALYDDACDAAKEICDAANKIVKRFRETL